MQFIKRAIIAVLTLLFVGTAPLAQASESTSQDPFPTEFEIRTQIAEHSEPGEHGSRLFNAEKATANGVDPRIVEIGELSNRMIIEEQEGTPPNGTYDLNPTNYGNWCGANNSGPGEPINSLDRACMGHDICLQQGTYVCDCDTRFVNSLRIIRHQYAGWDRTYLEAAIIAVPAWHGCSV